VTGLVKAELIKTFKRRTFWVLLVVLAVLTGLLAFVFFFVPRLVDQGFPLISKPDAYTFGAQQVLGQPWFPLILAVMALAGELATSTWATALTRNARRGQHLAARLVTTTSAAWGAMLAAVFGFGVVAFFFASGSGFLSAGEVWDIIWKTAFVMFSWVSLGLAASAWFRSVGPAIGAVLAFSFGESILSLWEGWRQVSLSTHVSALLGDLSQLGDFGSILGDPPSFEKALVVVAAWGVGATLAAWAGLQLRDA
jgi:hypothetical protein